jgi:DNA-binding response OmpR family regulator
MWIYREKGFGSSYRLFLPRHVDAPVGATNIVPAAAPAEEPVGGTETVLLVEDDPAIRSLTARALRQGGYHVLDAVNGHDALQIARTHVGPLHLVLSDLVMPQMNGDELLLQIRAKRASTRLVLMSGYTASVARPERLKAMNVQFLDKPFTPDLLLRRVRAALDAPA